MTKQQDTVGKIGQKRAARALQRLGVHQVEKIGTPAKYIPFSKEHPGVYHVIFSEKVAGDHRGILPGGRSVLAEVKTILERPLRYSDLREEQPAALQEHADNGGLTLLIWVHVTGVYIMQWPVPGFGPGKSIKLDQAAIENARIFEEMRAYQNQSNEMSSEEYRRLYLEE